MAIGATISYGDGSTATQSRYSPTESALGGLVSGATLGAAPKISGAAAATGDAIERLPVISSLITLAGSKVPTESWSQTYQRVRDASANSFQQMQQQNPKSYLGGQVGGAVVTSLAGGEAIDAGLGLMKGAAAAADAAEAAEAAEAAKAGVGPRFVTAAKAAAKAAPRVDVSVAPVAASPEASTLAKLGMTALKGVGNVAKVTGQGVAQGALGAALSNNGGSMHDKMDAAEEGALTTLGGLNPFREGINRYAALAEDAADLIPGAAGVVGKIGKAVTPVARMVSGTAGQLAGQDIGSTQEPTDDEDYGAPVDVGSLLKNIGVDPNTPDGLQKGAQVNHPDFETQETPEGEAVSSDVPQVVIKNGSKVLITPSGKQVPIN